jgi:phage-related protein
VSSSKLDSLLLSEYVTHVSNYSGSFNAENDYQKFDIVYNTGDSRFYYAKQNYIASNGILLKNNNRVSFFSKGPVVDQGGASYIVDSWGQLGQSSSDLKVGHIIDVAGSQEGNDGQYRVIYINAEIDSLYGDSSINGSLITILPINDSVISDELAGEHEITIQAVNSTPSQDENAWSSNRFFFDADYGSTVKYRCNNDKFNYGNGYYNIIPKSINNVSVQVNLVFKDRTNREANSIVHFLENHKGQHNKSLPSVALQYTNGISGFFWDGSSCFHPYDSVDVQSKRFYCNEWNHNLVFENSNDLSVNLVNYDSSILNKSDGIFIGNVDAYSDSVYYEKHDIVLEENSQRFYYWSGDHSEAGMQPSQESVSWSRDYGYYQDINTEYWTREFYWRPSLSLSVNQSPRLNTIISQNGYNQVYRDGINESLLKLNLEFNGRSDHEIKAILHFLEQHYGAVPFAFSPPAPYESIKNFVCLEWEHRYNFKNNHSVRAVFEQFPINIKAQEIDGLISETLQISEEIKCPSTIIFSEKNKDNAIDINQTVKKRVEIKNIGGFDVDIIAMYTPDAYVDFNILGHDDGDTFPIIVEENFEPEDFVFQLNNDSSLPFDLSGKLVRMSKKYNEGLEGGETFTVVESNGSRYVPVLYQGSPDVFFQNNKGEIFSIARNASSSVFPGFLVEGILKQNMRSTLGPGQKGYFYIVFQGANEGLQEVFDFSFVTKDSNEIAGISSYANKYFSAELIIENSSPITPYFSSEILIYIK